MDHVDPKSRSEKELKSECPDKMNEISWDSEEIANFIQAISRYVCVCLDRRPGFP